MKSKAKYNTSRPTLLLLFLLILSTSLPAQGFSYGTTLFSLAQLLMNRVADLRASRGDLAGAERAKRIAEKLDGGFGYGEGMWWEYVKNYACRDMAWNDMFGAVSDMNELWRALNNFTRLDSAKDKAAWAASNYERVLLVFNSLYRRFLISLRQSGPLRELVVNLHGEVKEGDLLRDCLEVGTKELKDWIQVAETVKEGYLVKEYIEVGTEELKGLIQSAKDTALEVSSTPAQVGTEWLKSLMQVAKDTALQFYSTPAPDNP